MKKNKDMFCGIKIDFKKTDNQYFEDEWNNDIDCKLLILALLETINDICQEHNLDMTNLLAKYVVMGSMDCYNSAEEKELMEKYKTY